jgi:hypothetical protein
MMNESIKIKKGLRNSIIGGLLFGSSIAAITQVQASQRYSRDSRSHPQRNETQGNREEVAANMTPEEKAKQQRKARAKQREKARQERIKVFQGWERKNVKYACQPK